INEEASDKVLEVEQQYNEKRKPVYEKRNDIIKSIPDFWLTAFLSHPALGDLANEEDKKIFKYLSSLEVEDFKDVKSGYSITFVSLFLLPYFGLEKTIFEVQFISNPYFEDTKLTKTFTFLDEGTTKVTATSIKWKEGMGNLNGVANEKKGNKRPHGDESFFTWFTETQPKDDVDDFQDEIAEIIKEDLWPNPLTFFSNEADEDDSDGEEDEIEVKKITLLTCLLYGRLVGSSEDDDEQEDDDDNEGDDEDGN
ncbi:hypothetical protein C3L33_14277, partial [Rhododendron williamsianum]